MYKLSYNLCMKIVWVFEHNRTPRYSYEVGSNTLEFRVLLPEVESLRVQSLWLLKYYARSYFASCTALSTHCHIGMAS